jgi:hypothetical protein
MSHNKTPQEKRANIPVEISLVDLVFQTFLNWGNKQIVVKAAAIKPKIVIESIVCPTSIHTLAI